MAQNQKQVKNKASPGAAPPRATQGKHRAQAAIFDGIMFLLLSSFSVAIIFSFLNNYGAAQDRVMQSANIVNYMHGVMKQIYYVDASTLANVDNYGNAFPGDYGDEKNVYGEMNCSNLSKWSSSVADVVKKDLLDGKLDDKFGNQGGIALGKTALRCLFKETMKPFRQAGYHYFVEILNPDTYFPLQAPTGTYNASPNSYPLPWVTDLQSTNADTPIVWGCADPKINTTSILAVSMPFRVLNENAQNEDYQIRVCIWR